MLSRQFILHKVYNHRGHLSEPAHVCQKSYVTLFHVCPFHSIVQMFNDPILQSLRTTEGHGLVCQPRRCDAVSSASNSGTTLRARYRVVGDERHRTTTSRSVCRRHDRVFALCAEL